MKEISLTQEEMDTLRAELPSIQTLLEQDETARIDFFTNPFKFLKKKFKIILVDLIGRSKDLIKDFNKGMKKLFEKLRDFLNDCAACKIATQIIIYGLLAKFAIPLIELSDFAAQIISLLEDFFDKTSLIAEGVIASIIKFTDKISPAGLALLFCREIGMCEPLEKLIPIPVIVVTSKEPKTDIPIYRPDEVTARYF